MNKTTKATYDKKRILHENHWKGEHFKQRITASEWKQLLLHNDDEVIFEGHIRKLVAKKLGYGVVEISKEKK